MKLTWGITDKLIHLDWAQVELNINDTARPMQVEGVVVRAALWGRKFGGYELVVPVESVEASGVGLMVPNLFARVLDLNELAEMNSVWGVDGLARDGAGNVLRIPDSFVRELIAKERERFGKPIRLNDFVRILWGPERMLCGEVTRLEGRRATVHVSLRSRRLVTTLPISALWPLETNELEYFHKGD